MNINKRRIPLQNHRWAERLDSANEYVIENTGLTKEKLFEVLQVLDAHNIIR